MNLLGHKKCAWPPTKYTLFHSLTNCALRQRRPILTSMHKIIVHSTELCIGSTSHACRGICRLTYFRMHKCTMHGAPIELCTASASSCRIELNQTNQPSAANQANIVTQIPPPAFLARGAQPVRLSHPAQLHPQDASRHCQQPLLLAVLPAVDNTF